MGKLTISAAEAIELKHGFTPAYRVDEAGDAMASSVTFKRDKQKARDLEIKEQALQEIMKNRGVSRKEALKILANPF